MRGNEEADLKRVREETLLSSRMRGSEEADLKRVREETLLSIPMRGNELRRDRVSLAYRRRYRSP